eukprot:1181975-Prorocentrum_minimum.AAC.1
MVRISIFQAPIPRLVGTPCRHSSALGSAMRQFLLLVLLGAASSPTGDALGTHHCSCLGLQRFIETAGTYQTGLSLEAFRVKLTGKHCAIVGNSGCLLHRPYYGKTIDEHDIVLRVNQAPYETYEKNVGSKTSLRLLNKVWSTRYSYSKEDHEHVKEGEEWGKILVRDTNMTLISSRSDDNYFNAILKVLREESAVCALLTPLGWSQKEHKREGITGVKLLAPVRKAALNLVADYRECMLRDGETEFPGGHAPTSGLLGIALLVATLPLENSILPQNIYGGRKSARDARRPIEPLRCRSTTGEFDSLRIIRLFEDATCPCRGLHLANCQLPSETLLGESTSQYRCNDFASTVRDRCGGATD